MHSHKREIFSRGLVPLRETAAALLALLQPGSKCVQDMRLLCVQVPLMQANMSCSTCAGSFWDAARDFLRWLMHALIIWLCANDHCWWMLHAPDGFLYPWPCLFARSLV